MDVIVANCLQTGARPLSYRAVILTCHWLTDFVLQDMKEQMSSPAAAAADRANRQVRAQL